MRESRSYHDLLEVHQKTDASEDELLIYAVTVLGGVLVLRQYRRK